MAARRLRPGEELLDIQAAEHVEGYQVHSRRRDAAPERRVLSDAPPRRFVTRLPDENGEVRVSPLVDAMVLRLRARRTKR